MPDNEEIIEEPQGEKTEAELDAELEAEAAKLLAEPEEEAETPAEEEKPKTEVEKAAMTDEEAQKVIRDAAKQYGWQVVIPGEAEAEKASAKEEGKAEAEIDLLAGLSGGEVPQEVLDEIDRRFPGEQNARKREVLYIQAATRASIEEAAAKKAQEAVAPIVQGQEQAAWQAKAQATARDIATKAEVPEAQEALAKLILEAGPESEERYRTDPLFKKMMDATIKQTVMEIADSLGSQEQKPLPTAERVGGGKSEAVASMDTLTGEAKAMAAMYKGDLSSGLITKEEYDSLMKNLQKESASK